MIEKRFPFHGGELDICAKLKDKEVLEIMVRLESGEKQIDIANDYDTTSANISAIKHGVIWSHLTKYPRTRVSKVKMEPIKYKLKPRWLYKAEVKLFESGYKKTKPSIFIIEGEND